MWLLASVWLRCEHLAHFIVAMRHFVVSSVHVVAFPFSSKHYVSWKFLSSHVTQGLVSYLFCLGILNTNPIPCTRYGWRYPQNVESGVSGRYSLESLPLNGSSVSTNLLHRVVPNQQFVDIFWTCVPPSLLLKHTYSSFCPSQLPALEILAAVCDLSVSL